MSNLYKNLSEGVCQLILDTGVSESVIYSQPFHLEKVISQWRCSRQNTLYNLSMDFGNILQEKSLFGKDVKEIVSD